MVDNIPRKGEESNKGPDNPSFGGLFKHPEESNSKPKKIVVHLMLDESTEYSKPFMIKGNSQDFTKHKKTFPVERKFLVRDSKGRNHLYVDVNKCITYSFKKQPTVNHCRKCGGQLTIDARNVRDLVKRKTITTFWGVDSMPLILMIVMGIIILGMFAFAFYLYSDNKAKDATIDALKNPSPPKGTTQTTPVKLILPMVINS